MSKESDVKMRPTESQLSGLLWEHQLRNLDGQLRTLVDASIGDIEQRKALKTIVGKTIWDWFMLLPKLESEGLDSPNFKISKQ